MAHYLSQIRKMTDTKILEQIEIQKKRIVTYAVMNQASGKRAMVNLSKYELVAKERNLLI